MPFTTLSGHAVHPVPFGTMQWGGKADATAARALYDACREAGINHFDTAWAYTDGQAEQMLGRFAATERDDIFIATKAANQKTFTAEVIDTQLDDSRRRLGVDVIDLFYIHQWDAKTPLEQPLEAIARHREAGRIRHVAVSNFAAWQVMKARRIAEGMGFTIEALQPMYSLVKRQAEVEILPMAVSEGMAVFSYSALGGGLLTGKYQDGGTGRITEDPRYTRRYGPAFMHDAAAGLKRIAEREGVAPATLAVAWALHRPGITGPIISARSVEQLRPSLAALDYTLSDALADEITALSPTPPPPTDRLEEAEN